MSLVVAAVGVLIVVVGFVVFVAPERLKRILEALEGRDRYYAIAVLRIAVGVIFVVSASEARVPAVVRLLGVVFIAAGILIPLLGAARVRAWAAWWLERGGGFIRAWALVAILLGTVILWAA